MFLLAAYWLKDDEEGAIWLLSYCLVFSGWSEIFTGIMLV